MAQAAGMITEIVTIPLDTAKVRMQLQTATSFGSYSRYNGLIGTTKTIILEEGPFALWNGLTPGLQRQIFFAGIRLGFYIPIRDAICRDNRPGSNPTIFQKVAAGMITGALGIAVANPTDVVKIRMQAQGQLPLH